MLDSFKDGNALAVSTHSESIIEQMSPDEREQIGLCPLCGVQLYDFKNGKQRVPLTVEGKVLRGQCLSCVGTRQTSKEADCIDLSNDGTPLSLRAMNDKKRDTIGDRTSSSSTLSSALTTDTTARLAGQATAIYKGSYNDYGERHGKGEMTWTNGDKYVGDFANGMRHGVGTLQFADGTEYVGEWFHNQMHGSGTRRFANGDCYIGPYTFGKRTGPDGRLYFANGDLYHGNFVDGKMSGFGRYYYASGKRFEGNFLDGKRHGKGKTQRLDGTLEVFLYVGDERVGTGTRWSADRTKTWQLIPKVGPCMGRNYLQAKSVGVAEAVSQDYRIEQAASKLAEGGEVDIVQLTDQTQSSSIPKNSTTLPEE